MHKVGGMQEIFAYGLGSRVETLFSVLLHCPIYVHVHPATHTSAHAQT